LRERLAELAATQEPITHARRVELIDTTIDVLVDGDDNGVVVGRSHREAPEIDGVVRLVGDVHARPGVILSVEVVDVEGPDLLARAQSVQGVEAAARRAG